MYYKSRLVTVGIVTLGDLSDSRSRADIPVTAIVLCEQFRILGVVRAIDIAVLAALLLTAPSIRAEDQGLRNDHLPSGGRLPHVRPLSLSLPRFLSPRFKFRSRLRNEGTWTTCDVLPYSKCYHQPLS